MDDSLDEGPETLTLRLSGGENATLEDPEGTGTIENDDALPAAWLARYGRTVAWHVMDAVDGRLHGDASGSHVTLGGVSVGPGAKAEDLQSRAGHGQAGHGQSGTLSSGTRALRSGDECGLEWRRGLGWRRPGRFGLEAVPWGTALPEATVAKMTSRELLSQSAFRLTLGGAAFGSSPRWTAWGSGAATRFDGRAQGVVLDGEVVGATLGLDVEQDRWTAGMALAYNDGRGTYDDGAQERGHGASWRAR